MSDVRMLREQFASGLRERLGVLEVEVEEIRELLKGMAAGHDEPAPPPVEELPKKKGGWTKARRLAQSRHMKAMHRKGVFRRR